MPTIAATTIPQNGCFSLYNKLRRIGDVLRIGEMTYKIWLDLKLVHHFQVYSRVMPLVSFKVDNYAKTAGAGVEICKGWARESRS